MDITRTEVEQLLTKMRPSALSDKAVQRMHIALKIEVDNDVLDRYTAEIISALKPAAIDETLQNKLLSIVSAVPFRLNEKVVMFPVGTNEQAQTNKPAKHMTWMAAAACIAIGTLLALLPPNQSENTSPQTFAQQQPASTPKYNSPNIAASNFTNHSGEFQDHGVIWNRESQPMRMLRIEFQEKVIVKDPSGLERQLTFPREEVILIPEKID